MKKNSGDKRESAAKPTNEIIVYQPDETVRLEVRLENDMVWLNRNQMAELFGRDVKTIGKHIANALKEELNPDFLPNRLGDEVGVNHDNPVVADFATTARDGKKYRVEYYNLEMIVSVGFRVKSPQGVIFRRWANTVLREYLLRGYAFNTRINQLEDKMDRRLAQHDADIGELKDKVDFFVKTSLPPVQGVFYDGQVFDARAPR